MAEIKLTHKSMRYEVVLTEEEYAPFKQIEGLDGQQCYEEYGLRRDDVITQTITLDDTYNFIIVAVVPDSEEDRYVDVSGTLHDKVLDKWYDVLEPDSTALGEYYFDLGDNKEMYVMVIDSTILAGYNLLTSTSSRR